VSALFMAGGAILVVATRFKAPAPAPDIKLVQT
jgi:hypothetical protein